MIFYELITSGTSIKSGVLTLREDIADRYRAIGGQVIEVRGRMADTVMHLKPEIEKNDAGPIEEWIARREVSP